MAANVINHRESIAAAEEEVSRRRRDLQQTRERLQDTSLAGYALAQGYRDSHFASDRFRPCRTLSGHTSKIYSLDWCNDRIVSASQDGRLIVWNAMTSQKTHVVKLQCPWVMACAFSPSGQKVACGGLDNVLSIYSLRTPNPEVTARLVGHKGYISCCQFVPQRCHVITSSGDQTLILWDAETGQRIAMFGGTASGHNSDVMSLSINKEESDVFVSGSCDQTAKLWDSRDPSNAKNTFFAEGGDVNAVHFMPDGFRFGLGTEQGTCKIYDMRYGYQLQTFRANGDQPVNCMAFSRSGRVLFAGYGASSSGSHQCLVWDTLKAESLVDIGRYHHRQISCIGVSTDGSAVCTGSWDSNLKVFACAPPDR